MEFQDIKEGLAALTSGFSLMKDTFNGLRAIKDLLPIGQDRARIEKAIEEAECQSKIAETRIAQSLGYSLCHCTFPPQIMLGIGYRGTERSRESFLCPNCKRIWPPERPLPTQAKIDWDVLSL